MSFLLAFVLSGCAQPGSPLIPPGAQQCSASVRIGTKRFLARVTRFRFPEYPERSRHACIEGLAIATVRTDCIGKVFAVDIVESPDEYIAKSVKNALETWTVHPVRFGGRPCSIVSKIYIYFRIVDRDATRRYEVIVPGLTDNLR